MARNLGKKRGRKPGAVAAGSGKHPMDVRWRERGFVTIAEAATIAGLSKKTMYARMKEARFEEGRDWAKGWAGRSGPVYVLKSVAEALLAERSPPVAAGA